MTCDLCPLDAAVILPGNAEERSMNWCSVARWWRAPNAERSSIS